MSWLLIDNSNSRTKFALGDSDGLTAWRAVIPTSEITVQSLAALDLPNHVAGLVVGSVVPDKLTILEAFFGARMPVHVLSCDSPLGMEIHYPHPRQIGADRLANAAGVLSRYHAPAIVIDFGTAVTFDVISAKPAYEGGAIAPGLGAMTGYLVRRTALLPLIELEEPTSSIGKSTVHAMQVGAVIGYRGLVREILTSIKSELGQPEPMVIATGGDAALIAQGLEEINRVDPDITLEGLRFIARRVFGPPGSSS